MPYVRGPRHPVFHLNTLEGKPYAGRIMDEDLRRIVFLAAPLSLSLSIARTYMNDDYAIIWKFAPTGKIAEVRVEEPRQIGFEINTIETAILSQPSQSGSTTLQLRCSQIPSLLNESPVLAVCRHPTEKFFKIISYGHLLGRKIKGHIENKTMREPDIYIQCQRPMYELREQKSVLQALANIGSWHIRRVFSPDLHEGIYIDYVPYHRKEERMRPARQNLGVE